MTAKRVVKLVGSVAAFAFFCYQYTATPIERIEMIAAFVVLTPVTLFLMQYTHPLLYDYRMTDDAIVFVLFGGIPIKRIPFSNVANVRRASWWELVPCDNLETACALWVVNRPFRPLVVVRRKKGAVKAIVISPRDADGFVREVRRRMPPGHVAEQPKRRWEANLAQCVVIVLGLLAYLAVSFSPPCVDAEGAPVGHWPMCAPHPPGHHIDRGRQLTELLIVVVATAALTFALRTRRKVHPVDTGR